MLALTLYLLSNNNEVDKKAVIMEDNSPSADEGDLLMIRNCFSRNATKEK